MIDLDKTPAFKELTSLAKKPYCLKSSVKELKNRIQNYYSSFDGFDYHYYAQRVDEDVLCSLQGLSDQAGVVGQYRAMFDGQIINKIEGFESENRQVLHTATRACLESSKFKTSPKNKKAIQESLEQLTKLKEFDQELEQNSLVNGNGESFIDLVVVGIGGSDLGPRAIYYSLQSYAKKFREVHFISNIDPVDVYLVLSKVNLQRTLVAVISKSGSTLETLTNERIVASYFEKACLDVSKHFICVTGKGSLMDNPEKYRKIFYMFDYIGGRFSCTSVVGAVPLVFALGYENFVDFLRGAHQMDINCFNTDIKKNISLFAALLGVWNRNFLGYDNLAILPYSQALHRFVAHLQQCDMESNGKSINRMGQKLSYSTGPVIWGEPGTNGQHAFYQLLHQGKDTIACEFIGFSKSQYQQDKEVKKTTSHQKLLANLLAQSIALAVGKEDQNPNKSFEGNRPHSLIMIPCLTPKNMGKLLSFYENKITFQGFLWNINSFDQEGVQLGKVLANDLLEVLAKNKQVNEDKLSHCLAKQVEVL